ncbi:hypothetical protein EDC96DRAFT_511796 [Choanephora cucurbitarum]|nr:hypothetical protein EDC96DRAFT_511796 [Choanephora cucurbitarum]
MQSALEEQAEYCSGLGNQYASCSPTSSDVWTNGSTYNFIWNYNYPYYVRFDNISLYLYYIVRYEYVSVKNFTNLPEKSGGIEVTVDDSWFLSSLPAGSPSQNLTMYGFYLPSSANPMEELASTSSQFPRPFNFTVVQYASMNQTNSTTTVPNNNNNNNNNSNDNKSSAESNNSSANNSTNSSGLPNWAIAVIVIAIVALVCGATALAWTMLLSRKSKRKNKLLPIINNSEKKQTDTQSMHSQVKMTAFRSTESVPMSATTENGSTVGTLASRNHQPLSLAAHDPAKLSSTDALLLSLGRNNTEWSSEEDEELRRRRLGEALLQRQLEEDGTSVKHAGRFTRVKSMAEMQKSAVFERPQP